MPLRRRRAVRVRRPRVQVLPRPESEAGFLEAVRQLARLCGYRTYHTYDSRKSEPGFPDLVMVKPGHPVLFIETKTLTGTVTLAQRQWLTDLQQTKGLRAEVWRPDMWGHITAILVHGMP
jgi:hypothetical protein